MIRLGTQDGHSLAGLGIEPLTDPEVLVYGEAFGAPASSLVATPDSVATFGLFPVDFDLEPGTALFFSAILPDGSLVIGSDSLKDNQINSTYIGQSMSVFDPETGECQTVALPTTTGDLAVVGSNGVTGGADISDVAVVDVGGGDIRPVGVCAVDYRGQQISLHGRFYVWVVLEEVDGVWQIDLTRSRTADQLATAPTIGPLAFPDTTNTFGEHYAANKGLAEIDVLPASGHVAITLYFVRSGLRSGAVCVIDPTTSELVAWYQLPDYTGDDASTPTVAPRSMATDPTGTLGAERFAVVPDISGGPHAFPVHPFTYDATNPDPSARITAGTPFLPILDDVDVAYSSLDGRCNTICFGEDGTLYVATSRINGLTAFNSRAYAVFKDYSYDDADPLAAYPARVLPDWFLGATIAAGAVARGFGRDGDMLVVVGNNGQVRFWQPDSPLVDRPTIVPNGTFAANVSGWAGVSGSATVAWDSSDGGRMHLDCNPLGGFATGTISTPTGTSAVPLPVEARGQSFVVRAKMKPTTTARMVQCAAQFYTSSGAVTGGALTYGPKRQEVVGSYVECRASYIVPADASYVAVFDRVNSPAQHEGHEVKDVYAALAPFKHGPVLDLAKTAVTSGQLGGFQTRGATIDVPNRRMYTVLQQLETTATCAAYPCPPYLLPQWVYRVNLDLLQSFVS